MKFGQKLYIDRRYDGQFLKDKPHGLGRMNSMYELYEGEFKEGKKHGRGRNIRHAEHISHGMPIKFAKDSFV